jgi:hypothetical protein
MGIDAKGTLAALVSEDRVQEVEAAFTRVLARSFVSHPVANRTTAEVKRRFEIVVRIFATLRADAKWSVPRCIDHLGPYLRCELDGVAWEPSKRSVWLPGETS